MATNPAHALAEEAVLPAPPTDEVAHSTSKDVAVDMGVAVPSSEEDKTKPAARNSSSLPGRPGSPRGGSQNTPVVFRDLCYTVKARGKAKAAAKGGKLTILNKLNGCFEPAQMSALMGPSGSGKTTLLDILAGRKTQGDISGEVLFAAQPPTLNFLRRFTGYVEQFDTMLDILTVREMLLYTAELKRPVKEGMQEKEATVDYFIDKLGLGSCKDTPIGSNLNRGISGGQAKRTNVALAMVVNPRVLFLDEPTSGLDSYTANETMAVVKSLTSEGVTICATIHSPPPYTFQLFDRLLVLVRGETVYFGPNGDAMVDYFRGCGVAPPHTMLSGGEIGNNADYLTDLVVGADREGRAGEYGAAYDASALKREMDGVIERNATANTMNLTKEQKKDLNVKRATVTPTWKGFATLVKYRTTRNYKSGEFLGPRIGDKFIFTILVATLYLGIGDDFSPDNYINQAAVLFMWSTLPAFGAASYVPALTLEKPLFVRERSDGLYKPITYLLSKFFDEVFITVFASLGFSAIAFFVVQLEGSFALFWLVYLCTLICGISCAYIVAILSPNMDVANAALPTYTVTLLFFAGFLFRFDDMPPWWQWYAYLDYLRYGFGAHLINQFSGHQDCPQEVMSGQAGPGAAQRMGIDTEKCVLINGVPVLQYYSVDQYGKWEMLGYEFLFFIVFFFLAWAALQFKTLAKR